MLPALKFVIGAVAKKDYLPALTHFRIEGGKVRGYNGSMALCCPISLDLNVTPKALQFIKAIETCQETIAIHMTPNGRLSIKSGSFKAFVECMDEPFPTIEPEGEFVEPKGGLLDVLKTLAPFIAEDASRPWARGIMFRGSSAFVTNNVILIEHWLGYEFPVEINIPKSAVVELLRIGEEPERLQVSQGSVTFHFKGDRWLRTQLYETNWPDLTPILNRENNPQDIPTELWTAVETLAPFTNELGQLYLGQERVATSAEDTSGASFAIPGLVVEGCYNHKYLLMLREVVEKIDLSTYPNPCIFIGKGGALRGAIVGMRGH